MVAKGKNSGIAGGMAPIEINARRFFLAQTWGQL